MFRCAKILFSFDFFGNFPVEIVLKKLKQNVPFFECFLKNDLQIKIYGSEQNLILRSKLKGGILNLKMIVFEKCESVK